MSCYPEINLLQTDVSTAEFASFLPPTIESQGFFQLEELMDGERKFTLHILTDEYFDQFNALFTRMITQTDWALTLDWDGLDEEFDFPYKSLRRPAGAKAPVLLWPND